MSLTGLTKHIRILEDAGLVISAKVGRVRWCRLGSQRLDAESEWLARFRRSAVRIPREVDGSRTANWFEKE